MQPDLYATGKDISSSIAFTGYRPSKLSFGDDMEHPDALRLREMMRAEFDRMMRRGYTQFLTGGALGCDMMAAEVIIELAEKYNQRKFSRLIHHVLCLPCQNHYAKWNDGQRERFKNIEKNSVTIYVSNTGYYNGCMQVRNRYMVDTSSVLLAVYDGKPGGTKGTLEYAQQKGKKALILDPKLFTRIELFNSPKDAEENFCFLDDVPSETDGKPDLTACKRRPGMVYFN